MGDLKFKNPDTGTWDSIPVVGEQGPTGPPGPIGPPSGGVVLAGWTYDAEQTMGAVNSMVDILSVSCHVKPTSTYEIHVGWRAIQAMTAGTVIQYEVSLNGVILPTHSCLTAGGALDNAHSRIWIREGSWATDTEADVILKLRMMAGIASKIVYSPEIALIEIADPNAPTGGGGPIALDDLTDVSATGPSGGDVLTYDDAQSLWVPVSGGARDRIETRTTRPGWHRIATFQGAGAAEFTVTQAGRNESAVRVFTLSWTGERMQLSTQGVTGYENDLPNYALQTTGVYGTQYLDIESTATDAALAVEASWTVHPLESDPGAAFQPAAFTLSATEIAAPGGTATPWPAVAGGSAPSYALDDLTDADTTTTAPADGDVLTFDATALQWVPAAPTTTTTGGASVFASVQSGSASTSNYNGEWLKLRYLKVLDSLGTMVVEPSTEQSRIQVTEAGEYLLTIWAGTTTVDAITDVGYTINWNGTDTVAAVVIPVDMTATEALSVATRVDLAAGDTLLVMYKMANATNLQELSGYSLVKVG